LHRFLTETAHGWPTPTPSTGNSKNSIFFSNGSSKASKQRSTHGKGQETGSGSQSGPIGAGHHPSVQARSRENSGLEKIIKVRSKECRQLFLPALACRARAGLTERLRCLRAGSVARAATAALESAPQPDTSSLSSACVQH
jgi:hypothetical protein